MLNMTKQIEAERVDALLAEVVENGGFTATEDYELANLTDGYMVSRVGYEQMFAPDDTFEFSKYVRFLSRLIRSAPALEGSYIGGWMHEGLVYVDVSNHFSDQKSAECRAHFNKQIAYYDIAAQKEVKTPDEI